MRVQSIDESERPRARSDPAPRAVPDHIMHWATVQREGATISIGTTSPVYRAHTWILISVRSSRIRRLPSAALVQCSCCMNAEFTSVAQGC
eukprot:3445003-Pleurochrysis_carterae.AAC.1